MISFHSFLKGATVCRKVGGSRRFVGIKYGTVPVGVSSRYLDFTLHCKKRLRLLPNIESFDGVSGLEAYQIQNEYARRRRLLRIDLLPKMSEYSNSVFRFVHA